MKGRYLGVLLSIVILQAATTLAQSGGVTFRARVEDETRLVVVGAKVTLVNTATQEKREATTDAAGQVAFEGVGPAEYELTVESPGFQPLKRSVKIGTSAPPLLTLTMKIEITEEVSITGIRRSDERIRHDKNASALDFDDDLLKGVPVPSGNSLLSFITNFLSPAAQGTDEATVFVDGIPVYRLDIPNSAVRRIVVNNNPYSPEYRRPGKARVEVITLDGSRRHYHGNAGLRIADAALDSRNVFAPAKPDTASELVELGLGGPLLGNRTSYLVSMEHLNERIGRLVNAQTLNGPFTANVLQRQRSVIGIGRLDFRLGAASRLGVRYDFARESGDNNGIGGLRLPEKAQDGSAREDNWRFAASMVVTPNFVNEVRVVVSRSSKTGGQFPTGPEIIVNGAFEGGQNQKFVDDRSQGLEAYNISTYFRGRHTMRFGTRVRPWFHTAVDGTNFGGTFHFASLEAYGAGTPYLFRVNEGDPTVHYSQYEGDVFFQDEVRFRRNLSLLWGGRYDWQSSIPDNNNVAPRVAIAFAPGQQKTVLRAGTGVFYERIPFRVVERTTLYDGVHMREVLITTPSYPNPLLSGQTSQRPPSIYRIDPSINTPHLVQTSVSIEQAFGPRSLLSVEYANLQGRRLFRALDPNAPMPGTGLRPNPAYANILEVGSTGFLRSNALSVTFRGRIGSRLKSTAIYTYSRSTNNTRGAEPGAGFPFDLPADNYNLQAEVGRADFDVRHKFNMASLLELPGAVRIGAVLSMNSGGPYDITTGFDDNGDTRATDRPVGITRNLAEGPGFSQLDLRVAKVVRLSRAPHGGGELQFSIDAWNALNQTNLGNPVGVMSSPFFGLANSAKAARTVQIAIKFSF